MNPCWGLLVSVGPLPSGQSPPCPWLRRRVLVDDCLPFCKLVSDLPIVERNLETPWTGWGGTEGGGGEDSTLCPAPQGPTPQGSSWDGPAQYKERDQEPACVNTPHTRCPFTHPSHRDRHTDMAHHRHAAHLSYWDTHTSPYTNVPCG